MFMHHVNQMDFRNWALRHCFVFIPWFLPKGLSYTSATFGLSATEPFTRACGWTLWNERYSVAWLIKSPKSEPGGN